MNDDITWRQENERGFDPKAKFFVEYRKEAKDPFVQLYYETLSCFHRATQVTCGGVAPKYTRAATIAMQKQWLKGGIVIFGAKRSLD